MGSLFAEWELVVGGCMMSWPKAQFLWPWDRGIPSCLLAIPSWRMGRSEGSRWSWMDSYGRPFFMLRACLGLTGEGKDRAGSSSPCRMLCYVYLLLNGDCLVFAHSSLFLTLCLVLFFLRR
jgi:hypothetical protein